MDVDIAVVLESIDHRLELLNIKIDNSMKDMQGRIDTVRDNSASVDDALQARIEGVRNNSISSTACENCQKTTHEILEDLRESMVSKTYFKATSAAIGFMVLVAGLLSAWGKLIG